MKNKEIYGHLWDTYCNLIMQLANNGMNQVLVNSEALEIIYEKNIRILS